MAKAASCYFPDGTFAEFDSPCFPDQAASICCGQGHTCMSNNLCRWPDSQMPYPLAYIRGSCTDSSWNSADCGNVCKAVFPSQWDPIVACPAAQFCCEIDDFNPSSCCNLTNTTAHPLYTLAAASTVTVIGRSLPTKAPSVSVSLTTVTSAPGPTNSNNKNENSSGSGKAGMKIGIGAGVGGGVLLILVGVAVLFFFRRRKPANQVHPEVGSMEPHGQDMETKKAELPVLAEHKDVPMDTGYQKGGDSVVYSELGTSQRVSEMP